MFLTCGKITTKEQIQKPSNSRGHVTAEPDPENFPTLRSFNTSWPVSQPPTKPTKVEGGVWWISASETHMPGSLLPSTHPHDDRQVPCAWALGLVCVHCICAYTSMTTCRHTGEHMYTCVCVDRDTCGCGGVSGVCVCLKGWAGSSTHTGAPRPTDDLAVSLRARA